jgi:TRAP-type transport system periplasmic protein
MKKYIFTILSVLVIGSVILGNTLVPSADAKPIEIRAVSYAPVDAPDNDGLKMFIERVNKRAKGELVLKFLGGPEVVSPFDLASMASKGLIDMGFNTGDFYLGDVPGAETITWRTQTAAQMRKNGLHRLFQKLHEKANLFLLGYGFETNSGGISIFLKEDNVNKIADLKGLRLGDGMLAVQFIKNLGAAPVNINLEDMYTALERGVIDGVIYPTELAAYLNLQEVLDVIIDHPFGRHNLTFFMNLDKWNSIPKHLQSLLIDVCISVEKDMVPVVDELVAWAHTVFDKGGLKKVKFSPDEGQKMVDMVFQSEWENIIKLYPEFGRELVEMLKK